MAGGANEPGKTGRGFARDGKPGRDGIDPAAAPARQARSQAARNGFVVFGNAVIWLLFVGFIAAAGVAWYGARAYDAQGPLAQEKEVLITRNSSLDDIAQKLESQGVIDDAMVFTTAVRLEGVNLKAGEYRFPSGAPMREVTRILASGKSIKHSITFPEGFTSQMIIDRISQDDVLTGEAPAAPREGALLPDTYVYQRGDTRADLVSRMAAEQKAQLDRIWKARAANLPFKSPADLVILASIVEKETGIAAERPRVASVFINRLQKNMRLQSDPTVIYGIVGGKGKLDRALSRADLTAATPYNTYTNGGLPPGPIANPGLAAMEAVATPLVTRDLYFVADGTGGHVFAETLEQHNRNVAAWRKAEKQARDAQKPAMPEAAEATDQPAAAGAAAGEDDVMPPPPGDDAPAGKKPAGRARAFIDPVANTPKDPLLDDSFDLESPQKVRKIP